MNSAFFLFQLGPAGVEGIDGALGFFQLEAGGVQARGVAHDGGVFEGGAFGVEILLGLGDALFHGSEFAGFLIGELLFRGGGKGPGCGWLLGSGLFLLRLLPLLPL